MVDRLVEAGLVERRADPTDRRAWREAGEEDSAPAPRSPRSGYRAPAVARDPFFDKPYEPSAATAATPPSWEAAPKAATAARSGISANIKPKRKVAALFKAVPPEAASSS